MKRKKPTIADLRALKGKGQLTMLKVTTLEEAAAAEEAGIDIVSLPEELVTHPEYRHVAPSLFSMTGKVHLEAGTRDDYLRWSLQMLAAGADAVYCSAGLGTVEHLAREFIPVVGHVGLVPSRGLRGRAALRRSEKRLRPPWLFIKSATPMKKPVLSRLRSRLCLWKLRQKFQNA